MTNITIGVLTPDYIVISEWQIALFIMWASYITAGAHLGLFEYWYQCRERRRQLRKLRK